MKLVAEMLDKEADKEFRRFLDATEQSKWEKKIAKLSALPKFPNPSPNVYLKYLASKNPFVEAIKKYLELKRNGQSVWKHLTPDLMQACGHAKAINGILRQATPTAVQKIKSMVLDDETVRSFLFELALAINFFRLGYDVQFIDLEDKGNYDLLVSDGTRELEIECKTKSADAGRKITRSNFYLLCDVLVARLAASKQQIALLLKSNGRLSGRQEFFERLAEEIKRCLNTGDENGQLESVEFRIVNLPETLRIRNDHEARVALAPYWSPSAHYFVFSNSFTLIVGCESTEADRVLKAISEELKDGADQLSKTRPALMACFLEEIDDDAWSQLISNSGLANMSYAFLASSDRTHINFVAYSSDRTTPKQEGAIINFGATNLRFDNPSPKYPLSKSFFRPDS